VDAPRGDAHLPGGSPEADGNQVGV
jgi:hypothetical protein